MTIGKRNWSERPTQFDKLHRFGFQEQIIRYAPSEAGGIYVLWQAEEIICIGHTEGNQTIRDCLLDHCRGANGRCTLEATHYSWEATSDPAARQRELLELFGRTYRRPPKCQAGPVAGERVAYKGAW